MPIEPAWLQAGSTVVLVLVTGFYTYLLHRQNQRERRSYHTDTLRERVREWYNNLPEVTPTSVESAEPIYVLGESREFHVAPSNLEEDNYFQDLLKNHGDELRESKTRIEELQERFQSLEEQFIDEFDDTEPIETAPLNLQPTSIYPGWVFERGILLERTDRTKEDLVKIAHDVIETETGADSDKVKYPGDRSSRYGMFIITRPRDDSVENDNEIVVEALENAIHKVDDYKEYSLSKEAATILDDIESELEALRRKLVEYEGMATYPGDCKYIR